MGTNALGFAAMAGHGTVVSFLLDTYLFHQSSALQESQACPRASGSHHVLPHHVSVSVQAVGRGLSPPPELPVQEVLRHVQWSARAVSRTFQEGLEVGREKLRFKWLAARDVDPAQLQAMLSRLPQLISVDGSGCPPQHTMSLLALPRLTSLLLNGVEGLIDIDPLRSTSSLRRLELAGCRDLASIAVLGTCRSLTSLDISNCPGLHDISSLAACSLLTTLSTRNSPGVVDISCMASCPRLVSLDISECSGVVSVSPLTASCNSLTFLCMSGCVAITDVSAFSGCKALTCIDLSGCSAVTNIRALAACKPSLNYIDVRQSGASLDSIALEETMGEGYWLRQPLLLPPPSHVS